MQHMQASVITINGLPLSESYAERCIRSAAEFGVTVEVFPATHRYQAEAVMRALGLAINQRIYQGLSDQPIGDRDQIPKGQWWLTSPELGGCLSHYRLWLDCLERDEPIMILEHDAVFVGEVPEIPPRAIAMNLCHNSYPNTVGYVLTPRAARLAVGAARKGGLQPSDELLWRAALRNRPVAMCQPSIVLHQDLGISTIQFSRDDDMHRGMSKIDPWDALRDPFTCEHSTDPTGRKKSIGDKIVGPIKRAVDA